MLHPTFNLITVVVFHAIGITTIVRACLINQNDKMIDKEKTTT